MKKNPIKFVLKKRQGFLNSLNEKNRKIYLTLEFFLKLLVLATPLYLIEWLKPNLWILEFSQAIAVKNILLLFGYKPIITTTISRETLIPLLTLENSEINFGIDPACTAYRSVLAFAALVLAYNKKNKIKAIIFGTIIIFAVNILRITSLILYSIRINENIEFLHTFLWREGLITLILVMWLFWIKN